MRLHQKKFSFGNMSHRPLVPFAIQDIILTEKKKELPQFLKLFTAELHTVLFSSHYTGYTLLYPCMPIEHSSWHLCCLARAF